MLSRESHRRLIEGSGEQHGSAATCQCCLAIANAPEVRTI